MTSRSELPSSIVRLCSEFDIAGLTPRDVRVAYLLGQRDAVAQGYLRGEIDAAVAEELWRAIRDPGDE